MESFENYSSVSEPNHKVYFTTLVCYVRLTCLSGVQFCLAWSSLRSQHLQHLPRTKPKPASMPTNSIPPYISKSNGFILHANIFQSCIGFA